VGKDKNIGEQTLAPCEMLNASSVGIIHQLLLMVPCGRADSGNQEGKDLKNVKSV